MKLYKSILSMCVAALCFASCSDKDTMPTLTSMSAPVLNSLAFSEVDLQENANNPLLCTFSWKGTQFYYDNNISPTPTAPVSYELQMDKVGNNFAKPQSLGITSNLLTDVMTANVNTLLTDSLGVNPGDNIDVEFRVVASYGEGIPTKVNSSNTISLNLTPYKVTPVSTTVENIYIIGDMNGWDNTNTDFLMYRNSNDVSDKTYTYTGFIGAGCYFKFAPQSALGTYNLYCDNGSGTFVQEQSDGGAFYNETAGYYTITLDLSTMKYSIVSYDASKANTYTVMCFVGQWCNWGANGEDPEMKQSSYDPHEWTITLACNDVSYGVKFRAAHSWDNRWCPTNPNNVPYGVGEYDPTSQDNNISVPGAGTYYVKFNDLTGHYYVKLQE